MAEFIQEESDRLGLSENLAFRVLYLCCDMIHELLRIPNGKCTPDGLAAAIIRFLKLYINVFGEDHWVQKFHYMLHLHKRIVSY